MSKLYDEPVSIARDKADRRLKSFIWRRRRYEVHQIVKGWRVRHSWWSEDGETNRWYVRVLAGRKVYLGKRRGKLKAPEPAGPESAAPVSAAPEPSGAYDLYFDWTRRHWFLERVFD